MQNKVDTVNISAAYTEFLLNFMANRAPEAAVGEEAIIIATILTISFIETIYIEATIQKVL